MAFSASTRRISGREPLSPAAEGRTVVSRQEISHLLAYRCLLAQPSRGGARTHRGALRTGAVSREGFLARPEYTYGIGLPAPADVAVDSA